MACRQPRQPGVDLAGLAGIWTGRWPCTKNKSESAARLGNLDGLQATFGNQAFVLRARGDLDAAMTLLKEQERICRSWAISDGLRSAWATKG